MDIITTVEKAAANSPFTGLLGLLYAHTGHLGVTPTDTLVGGQSRETFGN